MNTTKRIYIAPAVERIELDNEISLILASGNAVPAIEFGDPGDNCQNILNAPNHFNNNPFA
ncbi:MAG TPA: hypothetical protein P5084_05305 [Paludibacter sp.]|nr:hypothetical protein [Paludibacter sp.]